MQVVNVLNIVFAEIKHPLKALKRKIFYVIYTQRETKENTSCTNYFYEKYCRNS